MSTQDPRISLIITAYKRPQLLEEALASVARSNVDRAESVEVIVVDNNSGDDTANVVPRMISSDFPFALYYVVETERGLSAARNCGMQMAKGEYIVFMDDDQQIEQHYLGLVCEQFECTEAVCVCGPIFYRNAENLPRWLPPLLENTGQFYAGDEIKSLEGTEIEIHGGNLAFDRQALLASGGFDMRLGRIGEELIAGEELDLQIRLQRAGKKIVYTPQLVQYHYLRPDRLTKKYWRRHQFDYGRTVFRHSLASNATQARQFAGAPLWLWGYLLSRDIPRFAVSLASRDEHLKLDRQLDIWFRLGQLREARSFLNDTSNENRDL